MSVALERLRRAPIWKYLRHWVAEAPDFLWAPTGGAASFVPAIGGQALYPVNEVSMLPGGVANPVDSQTLGRMLRMNDTLGFTNTTRFIAVLLVSGSSAAARGHLFKIGNSSTGIGVGHGSTYDESAGTAVVLLREQVAWNNSASGAWVDGLNVVSFGYTTENGFFATIFPSYIETAVGVSTTGNSAVGQSYINGRNDSIGSSFKVHAVAVYKRALNNASITNFRRKLFEVFLPLVRAPSNYVEKLFVPVEQWVPYGSSGVILPTLSNATYVPGTLSATGFRPRVTATA